MNAKTVFQELPDSYGKSRIFISDLFQHAAKRHKGLIGVPGKRNKYRLIQMNSQVRVALFDLYRERASDDFVIQKAVNEVNYAQMEYINTT